MVDANKEHASILRQLKSKKRDVGLSAQAGRFNLAKYLGTSHVLYNVATPDLRKIAIMWALAHKDISQKELEELLNALFSGKSREEKVLASMIIGRIPKQLKLINKSFIDSWLGQLEGWEEVDSFCDEIDIWLREDFEGRYHVLKQWNKDKLIEKRRASLVVLCNSVRHSDDPKLRDLSFQFIDQLKAEKHVMITKAISWLLRALIKFHKRQVVVYVKQQSSTLPRIAVREVSRKLVTGKK